MTNTIIPKFKSFNNDSNIYDGLVNLYAEEYDALHIPQIIAEILDNDNFKLLQETYCTPGVRVTGTTENGKRVVVYAHISNDFSHPENLQHAYLDIKNGAGAYPQEELYRLVKTTDEKNIITLPYDEAMSAKSGLMSLDEAFKNPHARALIGPKIAQYLELYSRVVGDTIDIYHTDDMDTIPRARLLAINLHTPKHNYGSFGGSSLSKGGCCFLGKYSHP
ncbi:MAG: hypothetical protein WC916_02205 [Candidatus Woesearchaeota archaeon]